jgi:hypothetical protein
VGRKIMKQAKEGKGGAATQIGTRKKIHEGKKIIEEKRREPGGRMNSI